MISMIVAMLAGTALRTIAPAHMPDREIEQGLSQLDAPLYQQQGGVGSIVAPTEVLPSGQMARQNEPDLHGQGQDAPGPEDAPQTQGSDAHGQGQDAPGPEDAPQTQGFDAHGQGQDTPGPGDAPQTQGSDAHGQRQDPPGQGQDASNPGVGADHQAHHVNGHVGDAQGPGHTGQRRMNYGRIKSGLAPLPTHKASSLQTKAQMLSVTVVFWRVNVQ